jgi:hypothetical protein
MNIHIALYKWKPSARPEDIDRAMQNISSLADKVPGIVDIVTGINTSRYGEGYTHVILVRGKDQAAIDNYRNHPDHTSAASEIETMEERGIGVDFET